jgi:molecular chaperone DnaK (HSP70)
VQVVHAHMEGAYGEDYDSERVQWTLTVPAGWSQAAKQAMLAAAKQAGLGDPKAYPPSLAMLHEPEAACLAVTAAGQHGVTSITSHVQLKTGHRVMVIDAGGVKQLGCQEIPH